MNPIQRLDEHTSQIQEQIASAFTASKSLEARMEALIEILGKARLFKTALLSSMQKTACVLMDYLIRFRVLKIPAIFIDTGLHFPHVTGIASDYARRLRTLTFKPEESVSAQTKRYGRVLHLFDEKVSEGPGYQTCCHLRKREPFLRAVKAEGFQFIINGLMQGEHGERAHIGPTEVDEEAGVLRIHPLFDWTDQELETYIEDHEVYIPLLYSLGYTSIGCMTCTTPTTPGEHPRAGRWRHLEHAAGGFCKINSGEAFTPEI